MVRIWGLGTVLQYQEASWYSYSPRGCTYCEICYSTVMTVRTQESAELVIIISDELVREIGRYPRIPVEYLEVLP